MAKVVVVYHSGYGHTQRQAQAVAEGAGAQLLAIDADGNLPEGAWETLGAADAIVMGSPTYMGTVSWQFKKFADASSKPWFNQAWKDKLFAGFTNSATMNGDKLSTLHYLFTLAVIYSGVAACATVALAVLGFPNAIIWGALMGIVGFVPFIGASVTISVVAAVALVTFADWTHIVAAPVALLAIHIVESQFITPTFVSRRCALNTVAVFTSIALLGWMWGAIGAIVAGVVD